MSGNANPPPAKKKATTNAGLFYLVAVVYLIPAASTKRGFFGFLTTENLPTKTVSYKKKPPHDTNMNISYCV
ncbi:hypothetical protein, partial [Enterobacter intestinihominis]